MRVSGRNQAPISEQGFGTGARGDPKADWYAVAMFSGQSSETSDALILGPSEFVPKLTVFETV